jgi:hypothetical protein
MNENIMNIERKKFIPGSLGFFLFALLFILLLAFEKWRKKERERNPRYTVAVVTNIIKSIRVRDPTAEYRYVVYGVDYKGSNMIRADMYSAQKGMSITSI